MKFMRWIFLAIVAAYVAPIARAQNGSITNFCTSGATNAVTQGSLSTNTLQGVIPFCTVTVYNTGTTTLATLSTNATGTALSNPFFAGQTGQWNFYAPTAACYDVVMSGGQAPNSFSVPVTLTGVCPGGGSVTSPDNALIATSFPGADLGAQLSAAIAAMGTSCGKIIIPRGSYAVTTSAGVMNPCITIDANGAVLTVPVLTTPFLVMAQAIPYSPTTTLYTQGGIRDITLIGPGAGTSTVGIWYGGDLSGVLTPTSWQAFLSNFYNVHIQGFGTGFEYAEGFQTAWFGGALTNNGIGLGFQNGLTIDENNNFHGTEFLNNTIAGIDMPSGATGLNEFYCDNCSIDYNGINVIWNLGLFNMVGGHMEAYTLPFVKIPPPTAGVNTQVNFTGMGWDYVGGGTNTSSSFIEADGVNDIVGIGAGNNFVNGGTVASIVNFNSVAGTTANRMSIEPYSVYTSSGSGATIPAYTAANSFSVPADMRYPIFTSYGVLTGLVDNTSFSTLKLINTGATLDIGNQAGVPSTLMQVRFHSAGTSAISTTLQTDGTQFSFTNAGGTGNAPLATGSLTVVGSANLTGGVTAASVTVTDTVNNSQDGPLTTGSGGDATCYAPAANTSFMCMKGGVWSLSNNGGAYSPIVTAGQILTSSITTTATTSESFTLTGMTSSGHCSIDPTNSAAISATQAGVTAMATNSITVTHAATAGLTYGVICTVF